MGLAVKDLQNFFPLGPLSPCPPRKSQRSREFTMFLLLSISRAKLLLWLWMRNDSLRARKVMASALQFSPPYHNCLPHVLSHLALYFSLSPSSSLVIHSIAFYLSNTQPPSPSLTLCSSHSFRPTDWQTRIGCPIFPSLLLPFPIPCGARIVARRNEWITAEREKREREREEWREREREREREEERTKEREREKGRERKRERGEWSTYFSLELTTAPWPAACALPPIALHTTMHTTWNSVFVCTILLWWSLVNCSFFLIESINCGSFCKMNWFHKKP